MGTDPTPPMTRLTSVESDEDLPAGMVLRLFDMPGGERPVAPVSLSHWSLEPGGDSGDDQHGARELWLIAVGRGTMICGGSTADVEAGDVVAIEPNQAHRLVNTGVGPVEVFSAWW